MSSPTGPLRASIQTQPMTLSNMKGPKLGGITRPCLRCSPYHPNRQWYTHDLGYLAESGCRRAGVTRTSAQRRFILSLTEHLCAATDEGSDRASGAATASGPDSNASLLSLECGLDTMGWRWAHHALGVTS